MRCYTAVLSAEPDRSPWNVIVPDLPGCVTWGTTVEEALANAREAIEVHLDGEPAGDWPPPPKTIVSEIDVTVEDIEGILRAAPVAAGIAGDD